MRERDVAWRDAVKAADRRKKADEVSWYQRFRNWMQNMSGMNSQPARPRDAEATDDFPTAAAPLTLSHGILKLIVGVISTVGNYREHNEDNFFVPGRKPVRPDRPSDASGEQEAATFDPNIVLIVADGMGGQQAGEHASRMAVEIIPRAIAKRLGPGAIDTRAVQGAIREAVAEANQEILGSSGAIPEYSNMGTTVVLALFRDDRAYIAGIGDSRAYRLREGRIEQLTKDHSLADALGEAGTITKEEIPNHKFKNILYLYLGCKDARQGPEDVRVLDVKSGDRFLLASDGLTGVVGDEELTRVLESCDDPQRAARVLVDQALANDSKDNVTCLVVHVANGAASSGI